MTRRANLPAGQKSAALRITLELEPHEALDLKLRQAATRIAQGFLDFVDLAAEAIDSKVYERFGFVEPARYLEERIGVSYRSVRRWLAVREGLLRLPPSDQPDARVAVAEIGSHKASALAPILGREGQDWREWIERAKTSTEEAMQSAVSTATGAKPRGPASAPGERFLRFILANVPPDEHDRVARVFAALMKIGETDNAMAAFLALVSIAESDLAAQGVTV